MILVHVNEGKGIQRRRQPVRIGIPCAPGELPSVAGLSTSVSAHFSSLRHWPDGSVRWLLCEALVSVPAYGECSLEITESSSERSLDTSESGIDFADGSEMALIRYRGSQYRLVSSSMLERKIGKILSDNSLYLRGEVCGWLMESLFLSVTITVFKESGLIECDIVLHNPNASQHSGGFWDLGSPGSVFLDELFLGIRPTGDLEESGYRISPGELEIKSHEVSIYQESSGGEHWRSETHLDRHGAVPLKHQGYQVLVGAEVISDGLRAEPMVVGKYPGSTVSCVVQGFWQRFPMELFVDSGRGVGVSLFPKRFPGEMELQGGEKRSEKIFFSLQGEDISALQHPLPARFSSTRLCHAEVPECSGSGQQEYEELCDLALTGRRSFFNKREVIDDYGWRNFGCVFADHEAIHQKLVSHYNNQYDLALGFGREFLRSGDLRWFDLFQNLVNHTLDIDIYWTSNDRAAYSHGLFWHTEHYLPANTATHRCYSERSVGNRRRELCGGGPANEHNYTTGLLLAYLLTGSVRARDGVVTLAEWVLSMDDGRKTILSLIDSGPTGFASQTAERGYHGPGRGAGNSVNALVDAFIITGERRYLEKAEELIFRVVHPEDNIELNRLYDAERRWSYLVFFQVLPRYLQVKLELAERDFAFFYAKESLLHYSRWMLLHEKPFSSQKDHIEIWTESWPAHDLRKYSIFSAATKYCRLEEREQFLSAAEKFRALALGELSEFETRDFSRPLAVVFFSMTDFRNFLEDRSVNPYSFAPKVFFVPQRVRVIKKLKGLAVTTVAGLTLILWSLF